MTERPLPENPIYTPCWCEENVYLLGKDLENHGFDAHVVFISNNNKTIAVCQAKGCRDFDLIPGHWAALWDYHVILILSSKDTKASWVYDFDSRLPMGCPFDEYVRGTFPPEISIRPSFQSWFRVVSLKHFLDYFASDRSHMLVPGEDSIHMSPPPAYPRIQGRVASTTNNLFSCYVDMESPELTTEPLNEARYGHVITLESLQVLFRS